MIPRSIGALLRQQADRLGDRPAIVDGDVTVSWSGLATLARQAAGGLAARGVRAGDRVVIWAPNRWEWVVAALGAWLLGAAIVPLNTRYVGAEARGLVQRSGARAVLLTRSFLGVDYHARLGDVDVPVICLDEPGWLGEALDVDAPGDAVADVLYTSGTTGPPKGVPMTHAQNLRTFTTWADVVGLVEGDRYLVVAPFFHAFGLKAGWLACLLKGAVILPLPTMDADRVRAMVEQHGVTVLPGPPAVYQTLLERGGLRSSTLRLAVTGAANVPVDLVRQMREELGFRDVLTAYGLTECCGVATMCRRDDDVVRVATTCGRVIPGVELRTVDAQGEPVPPGEPGEVEIRGYNVLRGYVDAPAATEAALHDGWLRTGDLGVLDEHGYLRIVDRLKDLVVVGGFKVAPVEIEGTLRQHPAVADVAVIGAPDPRLGEVTVAFFVARAPVAPAALEAWSREHMANFKVPRRFIEVDALPRNAGGKVLKTDLRARLAATA